MNNPFTKYKKLESARREARDTLQRVESRVDGITADYYGSTWAMTYGFKDNTERTLKNLGKTLDDFTKRVEELENVVRLSGLVEELDTTDLVKLPKGHITISDVLNGQPNVTRQFVVNKVK
jgi:hypothetical protein